MNVLAAYDRARHDAKIDQLYGDEPNLRRDYTLYKVEHPAEEVDAGYGEFISFPAHTDFYAFHSGDDAEVPSCVPIGETLCDYDESRATVVGHIDGLLPGEVEAAFLAMVEKL